MLLFSCCKKGVEYSRQPALIDVYPSCSNDGDSLTDTVSESNDSSQDSWLERTCSALRRNTLEELDVSPDENGIDDEDLIALSDAMRDSQVVTRLVLRNLETETAKQPLDLRTILRVPDSIKTLCLEDSGEEAVALVAQELSKSSTSVSTVYFKGNVVSPKGSQALCTMLDQNTKLKDFTFCHNGITEEGFSLIAQGLRNNTTLRDLNFMGNSINDVAMSSLCSSLTCSKSVEFLCLDFNLFGCHGLERMASMLQYNTSLQELHLFGNRIDEYGAKCLASALYFNTTLRKLVLSFNKIGNEGAISLAKALTVNKTLTQLSIASNHIEREGYLTFGELLPKMQGLENLNIGDVFDTLAVEAMVRGLERNTRLRVLHMESPGFDETSVMEEKLDFLLRSNKSGRSLILAQSIVPPGLWALALAKAGKNCGREGCPDVVHSFVKERPDLFQINRWHYQI